MGKVTKVFEDIKLSWEGDDFIIPADRALGVIQEVEEKITWHELLTYGTRRAAPVGRIASAWAIILRAAGVRVTDEEVYAGMFLAHSQQNIKSAINGIASIMIPAGLKAELAAREGK